MKNLVKLFAAGLVILGSQSFAQTNLASGQKITGVHDLGTVNASKGKSSQVADYASSFHNDGKNSQVGGYASSFHSNPALSTFKDERREMKAQGMSNKEINRTIKKEVREAKADRMQAQHVRQLHAVARTHSQMAQHRASARKAGR